MDIPIISLYYIPQVGIYAVAARNELEYEPGKGLIRYLDVDRKKNEKHQLEISVDENSLKEAKKTVIETTKAIRDWKFSSPPKEPSNGDGIRCKRCDFQGFCGMQAAVNFKHDSFPIK
jgi:DNA helicase II / ATP-dependent DNA helicase PcrA